MEHEFSHCFFGKTEIEIKWGEMEWTKEEDRKRERRDQWKMFERTLEEVETKQDNVL